MFALGWSSLSKDDIIKCGFDKPSILRGQMIKKCGNRITFDGFIFLFPGRVEDGEVAANGRCVHEFSISHAFPPRKKGFYQIFPVMICYLCLLNKIFVAGAILTIVNIVRDIIRIWFFNCPIGSCKLLNLTKTYSQRNLLWQRMFGKRFNFDCFCVAWFRLI